MLLALLWACTCPTFATMQVAGTDDPDLAQDIWAAVTDFAAWTGREGVCVPGVQVKDELRIGTEEIGAAYDGPHAWIKIARDTDDVAHTTWHELCHALDEQEGHSQAETELFSGEEVDNEVLYPTTASRRGEDFARVCGDGASAVELILAVDAACGVSRWGFDYAYVQEHVYTDFPRNRVVGSGVSLRLSSRMLEVGVDVTVRDATASRGSLLLLVDYGTDERWGIVEVDPHTGQQSSTVSMGAGSVHTAGAQLVHSDGPALVLTGWDEGSRDLVEVDLSAGTASTIAEDLDIPRRLARAAWSEGVLYVTGQWEDFTAITTAWSDGRATALDAPAPGYAIAPIPGGFEAYTDAGLARYVDGVWSTLPQVRVAGVDVVAVADDWRLATTTAGIGNVWVLVSADDGTYGLFEEPCQHFEHYATSWVAFGEEIMLVDAVAADEVGRVEVTVLSAH